MRVLIDTTKDFSLSRVPAISPDKFLEKYR